MERLFRRPEMKLIGIYLGFPPEGGGSFQYAQCLLAASMALPTDQYEVVVVYAHPAWHRILSGHEGRIRTLQAREGFVEVMARFALRLGFPLRLWHGISMYVSVLARLLRNQKCDCWIFPAQDFWTYALPTRNVGVIHDLMHRYEPAFPEVGAWTIRLRRNNHYRNTCAQASAILVDSTVGAQHVCDSYAVDPTRVQVLPYIAPSYIRDTQVPTDFYARYSLPAQFFFYPAQFWAHKNHIRLLQALASIRDAVPNLHLVLAGSAKNAHTLVRDEIDRLRLHDRVHMVGYVPDDDMPVFYRRARALIMPTFFGPTNIPPLEAMASGCPMAVSNVYAMPEQVGDAALLFDPASTEQIAAAMLQLGADDALCQRLAGAGRRRATAWGAEQFNARFRQILESTLGV